MSAPGTPKASEAAVAAVQDALGCRQWKPRAKGVPMQCWEHLGEYHAAPWTERGCPVAVAAADAAAPHIATQTLRDAGAKALHQYANDLADNGSAVAWEQADFVADVRSYADDYPGWLS